MRLKRLLLQDVRCFRGRRVFEFTDPSTGAPRDRVVLMGSNGSGKTTLLEVIASLLDFGSSGQRSPILEQAGLAALTIEIGQGDPGQPTGDESIAEDPAVDSGGTHEVTFACGLERDVEAMRKDWPEHLTWFKGSAGREDLKQTPVAWAFLQATRPMVKGTEPMAGGYVYFPSDRVLRPRQAGPIAAPPPDLRWGVRYTSADQWQGSLEQHWVWLNYLDLERAHRGERSDGLPESIELLGRALGPGRTVTVREGRIRVATPWTDEQGRHGEVLLDELPSGERQCAILFGEIARRKRPGAVLLIDEPEISLHPTLQRQLLASLRDVAGALGMQVFLATHSPEIVRAVSAGEVMSLDYPEYRFPGLEAADRSGEPQQ